MGGQRHRNMQYQVWARNSNDKEEEYQLVSTALENKALVTRRVSEIAKIILDGNDGKLVPTYNTPVGDFLAFLNLTRYTTEIEKVMENYDEMSEKIVGQLIEVRKNDDDLFEQLLNVFSPKDSWDFRDKLEIAETYIYGQEHP